MFKNRHNFNLLLKASRQAKFTFYLLITIALTLGLSISLQSVLADIGLRIGGTYGVEFSGDNENIIYGVTPTTGSNGHLIKLETFTAPATWEEMFKVDKNGKVTAASDFCIESGNCLSAALSSYTETDPQVNSLNSGKWCTSDGSVVNCTSNNPDTTVDGCSNCLAIGSEVSNSISGNLTVNGSVGIGVPGPGEKLEVAGTVKASAIISTGHMVLSGNDIYDVRVLSGYDSGLTIASNQDQDKTVSYNGLEHLFYTKSGGAQIGRVLIDNAGMDVNGDLVVSGSMTLGGKSKSSWITCDWTGWQLSYPDRENEWGCDASGYVLEMYCDNSIVTKVRRTWTCLDGSVNPCSCFPVGTKVTMADGSKKNIEEVGIGEKVLGANGNVNTVVDLARPAVNDRSTYLINDQVEFTPEHPFLTKEGWKVVDLNLFHKYQKEHNSYHMTEPGQLGVGDVLITENGEEVIETLEELHTRPSDEIVYDLILDSGDHSYIANGYITHDSY